MTVPSPLRAIASASLLAGTRVVEASSGLAAAYCGTLLAQLGAEVSRWGGATAVVASPECARLMQSLLHGDKQRVPDEAALERALGRADLVVTDQPLDTLGIPPGATVVALCQHGLDEDARGASALTAAAAAGVSFAIGSRDREPLAMPYDIAAYETGANAACAAIAGLLRAGAAAGAPSVIEVAARDVLANLVGTLAQIYVPYGRPWRREGTRPSMSGGVYPCGLFPCRDGYVAIYCRATAEWHAILKAMGDPPWSAEPRFRDPKIVATEFADEADGHLMPWLAHFTRAELMDIGMAHGFPVAPVRYVRETLDDAQFAYRGSFGTLPRGGNHAPLKVPIAPWRISEPADAPAAPAPAWAGPKAGPRPPQELLRGLRVLDFSWVWSGPMVTSILADLGAEVLKVEHPSRPDSLRQRGPSLRDGRPLQGPARELNPWFNQLNHGKKSIVADIKSPDDRDRLLALAAGCDIVVENMRPGALAECGLGYEDLARANPGVVMLSMSMAGQSGPLSRMKGYAGIMTSMAGLESVAGYASPEADAPFVGMTMTALGDPNGAVHGLAVLLAALRRRRATGRGAWIDLAQTDAILSVMGAPILEAQLAGHVPVLGNAHPSYCPHGHYPCRGEDRWIALSVANDAVWAAIARTVGGALAPLAGLGLDARRAQSGTIDAALASWTRSRERADVVAALGSLGAGCAPVASFEDLMAATWKMRRGLVREVEHPYLGRREIFVVPWRFDGRTAGIAAPAPLLGEHTATVLPAAEGRA